MEHLKSLLSAALLTICSGQPALAGAANLTISCGAVGAELQLCKDGVEAWSKQTGHSVEVVSTPNSATERLSFYQQILSAQSADIDIIQIDVVWPGMLAKRTINVRFVDGVRDLGSISRDVFNTEQVEVTKGPASR